MKKNIVLYFLFFTVGVGTTIFVLTNPFHWHRSHSLQQAVFHAIGLSPEAVTDEEGSRLWTCGMHPQVVRSEPGSCPICEMNLLPVRNSTLAGELAPAPQAERRIRYWRAPMDPAYISDSPGKSPMGMDLIPVYEGEQEVAGVVHVDPSFVQSIGVQSTEVTRDDIPFTIRTVGTLTYDESRMFWVNTKYEGWIEKVYVNFVGEPVTKGQSLFEIYSPQLVNSQQEYLQALDYAERLGSSRYPEIASRARSLLRSSRQRLAYWDLSDKQVEELEKTGQVRRTVTLFSPAGGLLIEKVDQALEGMHATAGMNLYKIADLSTIWVEAEIFEHQIPWLKVGQTALVEVPSQPGKRYRGRIRYVHPSFSEKTRSLRISIELPNPEQELRGDMYVHVTLPTPAARGVLTVPEEAVIHSGKRNIVVLDRGSGTFQVREVTLGLNGNGVWEVASGLNEGERVVVSSQFLIDSESNLKEAIRKMISRVPSGEPVDDPITTGRGR